MQQKTPTIADDSAKADEFPLAMAELSAVAVAVAFCSSSRDCERPAEAASRANRRGRAFIVAYRPRDMGQGGNKI